MSRPPRQSWVLATIAIRRLYLALEAHCEHREGHVKLRRLNAARRAMRRLEEFVHESEECERP